MECNSQEAPECKPVFTSGCKVRNYTAVMNWRIVQSLAEKCGPNVLQDYWEALTGQITEYPQVQELLNKGLHWSIADTCKDVEEMMQNLWSTPHRTNRWLGLCSSTSNNRKWIQTVATLEAIACRTIDENFPRPTMARSPVFQHYAPDLWPVIKPYMVALGTIALGMLAQTEVMESWQTSTLDECIVYVFKSNSEFLLRKGVSLENQRLAMRNTWRLIELDDYVSELRAYLQKEDSEQASYLAHQDTLECWKEWEKSPLEYTVNLKERLEMSANLVELACLANTVAVNGPQPVKREKTTRY